MSLPALLSGSPTDPSLSLSFLGGLPAGATFSRASSGSYFNASGVLTTAGSDVARIEYNPATLAPLGLLREGQATNTMPQSNDWTNGAIWTFANIATVAAAATGPDGQASAASLSDDSTNVAHFIAEGGASFVSGTTYCFSVFAKAGTATVIQLSSRVTFSATPGSVNFDLVNGSKGGAANVIASGMTPCGNGWWRCWFTKAAGNTGTAASDVALTNNNATATVRPIYTGSGQTLYVFGLQVEASNFPTSYMATTGTAATRAKDICTVALTAGMTSLAGYSATFELDVFSNTFSYGIGALTDLAGTQCIYAWNNTGIYWYDNSSGANAGPVVLGAVGVIQKAAFSISATVLAGAINGTLMAPGAAFGVPAVVQVDLANGASFSVNNPNGHISRVRVWPRALTATELVQVTT
jgi:hypothetical protein